MATSRIACPGDFSLCLFRSFIKASIGSVAGSSLLWLSAPSAATPATPASGSAAAAAAAAGAAPLAGAMRRTATAIDAFKGTAATSTPATAAAIRCTRPFTTACLTRSPRLLCRLLSVLLLLPLLDILLLLRFLSGVLLLRLLRPLLRLLLFIWGQGTAGVTAVRLACLNLLARRRLVIALLDGLVAVVLPVDVGVDVGVPTIVDIHIAAVVVGIAPSVTPGGA